MNINFKHRPDRDYKWEWYYSPQGPETHSVLSWCWATYGHPGTDPDTGVYSGWECTGGWIKFRDEKDMLLFVLRWT